MGQPFVGQIIAVGFNFAPVGWALCQGQLLPISENETLYTLIGTTFGGDGQSTFGLPDLRGRAALGMGQGPGLAQYAMGQAAGAEFDHAHGRPDRKPHPWAVGGGHGDNLDPFVVRRSGHARAVNANLRDGWARRDTDAGGGVRDRGRGTAARKSTAEPSHKLHHQPLRGVPITELNGRRRGGRRMHATFSRSDHAFPI